MAWVKKKESWICEILKRNQLTGAHSVLLLLVVLAPLTDPWAGTFIVLSVTIFSITNEVCDTAL